MATEKTKKPYSDSKAPLTAGFRYHAIPIAVVLIPIAMVRRRVGCCQPQRHGALNVPTQGRAYSDAVTSYGKGGVNHGREMRDTGEGM